MIRERSGIDYLALETCSECAGTGGIHGICPCVWRGVFRVCYDAYCARSFGGGSEMDRLYAADFVRTARLGLSTSDWRLFEVVFLRGLRWPAARSLARDRAMYFQAVYRIERRVGEDLHMRGLLPADYFRPSHKGCYAKAA